MPTNGNGGDPSSSGTRNVSGFVQSGPRPPVLDENADYETWRKEIEFWKRVTAVEKSKQAMIVSLSFEGKYKQVATNMDIDLLDAEDGMDKLLNAMDENFKKESLDSTYDSYLQFKHFRRNDRSMTDYILEFERVYKRMTRHGITYPPEVLGCDLLENAHLDVKEKQMVLSCVKSLKFDDMKSSLRRIFASVQTADDGFSIKTEAFFTGKRHTGWKKPIDSKKVDIPQGGVSKRVNPKNKYGKTTRCAVCGSIYHWAKECPDREANTKVSSGQFGIHPFNETDVKLTECERKSDPEPQESLVTIALTTGYKLLSECINNAVLDTGCTSSVCGIVWFDIFMNSLSESLRKEVITNDSNTVIVFGSMQRQKAIMKATFPVMIANKKCTITSDVIDGELPLLLSKSAMKKAGVVLNIVTDVVEVLNKSIKLKTSSSGHYLLPLFPNDGKQCTGKYIGTNGKKRCSL